jgi:RyR domain
MQKKQPPEKIIVVAGDVTIDWNIARREDYQGSGVVWNAEDSISTSPKAGGAALLADLIDAVAQRINAENSLGHFKVEGIVRVNKIRPDDTQYHHSYAIWSPHKYDESSPEHNDLRVWRVKNYLGFHPSRNIKTAMARRWNRIKKHIRACRLLVLDDATILVDEKNGNSLQKKKHVGFREQSEIWEKDLSFPAEPRPWIILKMARPVAKGQLWKHLLSEGLSDRLIVVVPVNELRFEEAQISRELSWERTAQDIVWELRKNADLEKLSQCAHVIISFGTAGAFWLNGINSQAGVSEASQAPRCKLFFDRKVIEAMWGQNHPGGVVGYTSCLVTSLAHRVMRSPDNPEIEEAIQDGLRAIRKLHKDGYGKQEDEKMGVPSLAFPIDGIVQELMETDNNGADDGDSRDAKAGKPAKKDKDKFSAVIVNDPTRSLVEQAPASRAVEAERFWMILRDSNTDLYPLAEKIVKEGAKVALKDVPLGEFGDLLTADRREIESYNSISALIREYCDQERPARPLSIAVFGPPGSGKSFGIIEVAKAVYKKITKLTFNLSQFSDPKELLGALHQVRDRTLAGGIPLVFWDEFDTTLNQQPLGWLRYFLAPMQDGEFQDGQITHPIGRAIFVFAGGTSVSKGEFEQNIKSEKLKDAKGLDFISRLRGFIDIMGPNPLKQADDGDPTHVIRRAILLRSLFERKTPSLFRWSDTKGELRIDEGVLDAFLKISKYRHGTRSMEAIIEMSRLAKQSRFVRSALPPADQLDLHVNGRLFRGLVQETMLNKGLTKAADKLARAAHEQFCKDLLEQGYTYASETDEHAKTHSSLLLFDQLPADEQEQNRSQVFHIREKLLNMGYFMIQARGNEPLFEFSAPEIESMAEMEHNRWLKAKLRNGWRYAPKTDKSMCQHQDMLLWRELSEDEKRREFSEDELVRIGEGILSESAKKKDRQVIRTIPDLLTMVGYTISKIQDEDK